MQVWLPASLSVIPNTAFLRRVSTPLADVTAWYSPRFRAGRDEMSACVKSIGWLLNSLARSPPLRFVWRRSLARPMWDGLLQSLDFGETETENLPCIITVTSKILVLPTV